MRLIIIEGNISAGKSTLTENLAKELNARPFFEPVKTNPYLELFYKDPERYALPMQFYLMSNRFKAHKEAIDHIWKTGQTCIFDRSIYGDFVFAKKNEMDGNMSELDFENYTKMRNVMWNYLMIPHITIYLKTDPTQLKERILARGRECEKAITEDYLGGLDSLYNELIYYLQGEGSNVVKIDWNEFKPTSHVLEKMGEYL